MSSVMWFRRDLRVNDHPALLAAGEVGPVYPLFVFDPVLWDKAGPIRGQYLLDSLASLNESLGGHLTIRIGPPADVVPEFAREVAAESVHISADYGPYGSRRDATV
nr:deoxyribodipyrimidine photo-lyase [Actinomycetes bacterium]